MPRSPRQVCRVSGCQQITARGEAHCDKHLQHRSGWVAWQQAKGNRHQRGYGSAWEKLRREVLARDAHLCKECLRGGVVTEGRHVDHIVSKAKGGTDALSNLQTLCSACHSAKTAQERHR